MNGNNISAPPEVQSEVEAALATLKKTGYTAYAKIGAENALDLVFKLGESEQTINFTNEDCSKSGTIQQRIVDKLEI